MASIINLIQTHIRAMHRLLRTIRNAHLPRFRFCTGDATDKNTPLSATHNLTTNFLPHVYGIEMQSHMIPMNKAIMKLSDEDYKFYKKASPNYVVSLIQRVLDDAQEIEHEQEGEQFYKVCTYCRISYKDGNIISLEGLHPVKIEETKKITLSKEQLNNGPVQQTTDAFNQEMLEVQEFESFTQSPLNGEDAPLIRKSQQSRKPKDSHTYYYLKVHKIYEPPLMLTPLMETKFKYLVNTYSHGMNLPAHSTLIYDIMDLSKVLNKLIFTCSYQGYKKSAIQECLETVDLQPRMDLVQKILQDTLISENYQRSIQQRVKFNLQMRKFHEYETEIMRTAKLLLEGKKAKQLFLEKCKQNFRQNNPPKEIIEIFDQEVERYQNMDENSMEAGVAKGYIEELSLIPYNVQSEEMYDLEYAQKVLDEEHYGMKEVKDAILEIIAVGKLKKTLKGKIFCFVGGPGLGKTSFAKSVAKALNRKFYNISLGGASDSSVLKGHRRTYMGAYSGKIIQALKNCGTNNPVILLDEIDKMGSSSQGDPRSELLEILDPNQNSSFVDNYVDVPVDLSNVLFITSANYEQNISQPLLDRMEKIRIASYTLLQKVQIFNRHLLRRAIDKTGVKPEHFEMSPETISALVEQYSIGEPGVRYLQKSALNILEKIAYKIVAEEEKPPIKVTKESLKQYLGNSYFRRKDHTKISKGVAISLGLSYYGGRLTYIEAFKKSYASRKDINRGILFTGSLGEVFKEAMNISYTFARNFLLENLENKFLYENQVHLHAPSGASKKDGSTDSLTIAAALISLAIQRKVKPGVALTGELTLNGQVLPTHGIKQKILVAKRQRITEVILPEENRPDVEELSDDVKEGIVFYYANSFSQVFDILFPGVTRAQAEAAAP